MAGLILETLSNKKLIAFTVIAFLCQIVCFLLGGLIAPAPYNVQSHLSRKCTNKNEDNTWLEPWGDDDKTCPHVDSLHDLEEDKSQITANHIVFAIRFPHRKSNEQLDMSRWHQNIVAVLQVDVDHEPNYPVAKEAELTLEARLGYKNKEDSNTTDWHQLVASTEKRQLKCSTSTSENVDDPDVYGNPIYKCEMLALFELGSCHHDYYLVNLRLPVLSDGSLNSNVPMIQDIWIYIIHPNGGFTKVWISLKTVMCPLSLLALCWHIFRVKQQERRFTLLEKTLIATGAAMSFLNLPVEWFTLWIHMPYMLLFSDIRQGIFYTILMSFWVIFAGEHLMDQVERNRLLAYWKHLSAVAFGCICLFVFEMCERGVQLHNPFYSIWSTPTSSMMALSFIILAGIAACVYFFFLLYLIVKVFRNITAKKASMPQMSKARRKFYMGLIYRFNFLMVVTLLCAAVTVIFFIVGQVAEGQWKWDNDQTMEYTSGFMTGAYGMWNIYVIALLILYAPSRKEFNLGSNTSEDEAIEFANLQTEASALTSFAQKEQLD